jgi:hypothetical protein
MGRLAKSRSRSLGAISSFADLGLGLELLPKVASIDERLGKDEFLYTHFLDVIFYTTLLGGKVRVEVAKQLGSLIARNPLQKIHVIAHSLGTAVLHDTLALLYRAHANFSDDIPVLDTRTHKLSSVWMVANVSRLIQSATGLADPMESVVRPGPGGCTNRLINIRHRFDPFTWCAGFDPRNDGSWVPKAYFDRCYRAIETTSVRQLNTHEFTDFIENPSVSVPLLHRLVRLSPSQAELERVERNYRQGDIHGAFDRVRSALRNFRAKDRATLAEVASTVRQVREIIRRLIEQRHAFAI